MREQESTTVKEKTETAAYRKSLGMIKKEGSCGFLYQHMMSCVDQFKYTFIIT